MDRIIKSVDYDYIQIQRVIDDLCKKYPVISKFAIGKSCVGRDIYALKLSEGQSNTLFAAAFHGSEHITANILLYFAEELAYAYYARRSLAGINVRKALRGRGVIFVPLVNPDGCEISVKGELGCGAERDNIYRLCSGDFAHWNANFRGVDINHNFNAGWKRLHALERKMGILGPAPTRFGGNRPESEPETAAMVSLCRNTHIHHAIALHSQGEVIYWDYDGIECPSARQMAEIMAATSGYALDVPIGIATGGGFKDWFIKEFNRPAFTVEVGRGKNPLPPENAAKIYAGIREMLTLCAIM